ncbi:hypothetical protein [Blastopirellula marina]|nr:hypothetical protein [Blastopirellula marina]
MKSSYKNSLAFLSLLFVGVAVASVNAQDGERGPRGPREGGPRAGGPREGGQRGPGRGQFGPEQMLERLMQLDKDSDGKLSKEEMKDSRAAAMFERADSDSDGFLTKEEVIAVFNRGPGRGEGGPGRGEAGPGRGEGRGRGMGPGGMGPGGMMGFQPGMIMPPFLMERLGLSEEQRKDVAALQQEVEKKLASILTEEQKEQLKEFGQRRPGGRPDGDRPQRARGPRDGEEGPRRGPRDGDRGPRRGPRDGDNN